MQIALDIKIAQDYKSNSQKIRVLSESWVDNEIFCPNCGCNVDSHKNNKPVADFYCPNCSEDYELKSQKDSMGKKIIDGAYKTMIERLQSANNPNFFFLNYDLKNYEVLNFAVIPKHFFVPEIIIKRNQGIKNRPDYIMCSIDLAGIPSSGKIFYIKNKKIESKEKVLENWNKTLFLRKSKKVELKGWILDIMKCIDKLEKNEFTINEMYSFKNLLSRKHPNNKHVEDKIRQQLQFLRDKGYLEFKGSGKYKLS
ncbi:restriction endonuclease [Patescibacteria group bacterium]|nr:restriction endonuclease [Patescibacteria group bacterium]